MNRFRRLPLVAAVALFAFAVPVLSVQPSDSPGRAEAPGQQKDKAKGPAIEVTLEGTIERTTDDKGRPTFTLTDGGTTWELSAGPKWWWGEDGGPLAAHVGKSVRVTGSHREGSTDVSVDTIDGATVAEHAGRPPWAGGPKAVGERHPGWHAWQAEGVERGKQHAPGQQKDKARVPADGDDETE